MNSDAICTVCKIFPPQNYDFIYLYPKPRNPTHPSRTEYFYEVYTFYRNCFYKNKEIIQATNQTDQCLYCLPIVINEFILISNRIARISSIVFKYNGKLFGGFVRDYLIPKFEFDQLQRQQHNPTLLSSLIEFIQVKDVCKIILEYENNPFMPTLEQDPKDVDIWIQTDQQRFQILQDLKEEGFDIQNRNLHKYSVINDNELLNYTNDAYGFPIYQYNLTIQSQESRVKIWIDIAVSTTFPTNDFSVNLLSYNGKELYCEQYDGENLHESLPVFTKDCIMEQIKNKTFYILPSIWITDPLTPVYTRNTVRLRKMLRNGYSCINADDTEDAKYIFSMLKQGTN